ncbi:MAG: hypothetical protein ACE5J6_03665 [Candidatus Bathyarchaeia archaeon]
MSYNFPTSWTMYVAERLLTVPPRYHGVLLWKFVSAVPTAIGVRIPEKPSQKAIQRFHRGAPCWVHPHLTFMNDEQII